MARPKTVLLFDQEKGESLRLEMDRDQGALWFRSPRHTTEDGQGWLIKMELWNGNLQILAWTDKNNMEPTVISFKSAEREENQPPAFSGGDGSSLDNAVVINVDRSRAGVRAEYFYVATHCGQPRKDWTVKQQGFRVHEGKPHDVLIVALSDGRLKTFYFDITAFFGK